jgi:acylphosphatase
MSQPNPNELVRVHIWVTGRVQGVGFRAFVQLSGSTFGLRGWVRNVGYDEVETLAEGRREVIDQFVELVKTGPHAARVDSARVEWEEPSGNLKQFTMRF